LLNEVSSTESQNIADSLEIEDSEQKSIVKTRFIESQQSSTHCSNQSKFKRNETERRDAYSPKMTLNAETIEGVERRAAPRFTIRLPLTIKVGGGEIAAVTRDISSSGVYFYLESDHGQIAPSGSIEFIIVLPPEITLSTHMRVACKGKVLRRHHPTALGIGMVAVIDSYSFINPAES
jgi:PilZ domain